MILGAFLLYWGGEALVRGAGGLALHMGISPLVVGLTVVSLSTSMPEGMSSLMAQLRGEPGELALGNVLGSNIANVGLILGLTALMRPLRVSAPALKREVGVMVLVCCLLAVIVSLVSTIERWVGAALFSLLGLYLFDQVRRSRQEEGAVGAEAIGLEEPSTLSLSRELAWIALGVVLLTGGGWALIEGAVQVGRALGISERVVGLTIVAMGTSLPELATSLVAAYRNEHEMALGNVVGSNVFNGLCVVGGVALVQPISYSQEGLLWDGGVMVLFAAALLPPVIRGQVMGRKEGAFLLAGYAVYMVTLFSASA